MAKKKPAKTVKAAIRKRQKRLLKSADDMTTRVRQHIKDNPIRPSKPVELLTDKELGIEIEKALPKLIKPSVPRWSWRYTDTWEIEVLDRQHVMAKFYSATLANAFAHAMNALSGVS